MPKKCTFAGAINAEIGIHRDKYDVKHNLEN